MKLFEMKSLPKKAGEAKLTFEGTSTPKRIDDSIVLPYNKHCEFYPLQENSQFLYRMFIISGGEQLWFGGTDEQPFLTRLQHNPVKDQVPFLAFADDGEDGFYNSLQPAELLSLVVRFGTKWHRQGDIFAVELPYSLKQLEDMALINTPFEEVFMQVKDVESEPVFRTRHQFSGNLLQKIDGPLIGEGVIEAPDHRPLKLEVPSILLQASHLYDPPKTD